MNPETKPEAADSRSAARWDVLTIVLCTACIALTVLVFLLARQNRALKAQMSALMTQSAQNDPNALRAGDLVSSFEAVAPTGETMRVGFGAGEPRTLLLVFSPDCPACQRTKPVWNRVLAEPVPASVRIVGLRAAASPPPDASVPEEQTAFPVYSLLGPIEKVRFVPATVLLDGEGVVQQVWFGELGEDQEAELRAALHAGDESG